MENAQTSKELGFLQKFMVLKGALRELDHLRHQILSIVAYGT